MAGLAERLTVRDIESKLGIVRERFEMMGVKNAASLLTERAGIIIACEDGRSPVAIFGTGPEDLVRGTHSALP
jgi:DnaJ-domain-containing protein 1